MEFKALDTASRIDLLIAEIPGPAIMLVPKWAVDLGQPDADWAEAKVAAMNEAVMQAQLVPLVDFGARFSMWIQGYDYGGIPGGNPGFSIARHEPK